MDIVNKQVKQHVIARISIAWLAVVLLLPASAVAAPVAVAMGGQSLSSFYLLGMELGPWEEYLIQELTPELAVVEKVKRTEISWFADDAEKMLPAFAKSLLSDEKNKLVSTFSYRSTLQSPLSHNFGLDALDPNQANNSIGLSRDLVSQGFVHQLNDKSVLAVSALMVHQRFGTSSLGVYNTGDYSSAFGNSGASWQSSPFQESSYGAGVWMGLESELNEYIGFSAGFQSRIDMDDFDSYRGVYSEPGDLDIPARAQLGFAIAAGSNNWFTAGIEHVLYSDLRTTPSQYLPERFISLLGDSNSPQFNWENLTVYSIGWRWQDSNNQTALWVDLSTRQQPSPTSAVLDRALRADTASNVMQLGFSTQTSRNSKINLRAAYAPPEYVFGGSILGLAPENLDQKVEVEALWVMSF